MPPTVSPEVDYDPTPVSIRAEIEAYLLAALQRPEPKDGKRLSQRRSSHKRALKGIHRAIESQTQYPVDMVPAYLAGSFRRAFEDPRSAISTVTTWLTGIRAMMRMYAMNPSLVQLTAPAKEA